MLPILARTTGSALARNLMGGKKKVAATAIRPTTSMVPQRKSGALVKQSKPSSALTKQMAPLKTVSSGSIAKDDYMGIIHSKVLEIESILKGTLAAEKEELRQKRKQQKDEDRANQEKKLEAKDDKQDKKGIKMPKVPEVGIFGWIKRFVGNVLLGIFFSKLVDFAPALAGFIKAADGITTFLADVGIKLVDGLATFVDWGYKAYDATQGFLSNFGVGQEQFDQFSGAVSGMIDALIIGSVILAARGEDGLGPGGLDKARRPGGRRPGVTQGRGGQQPRITNPFRRKPRVTQGGGSRRPGAPVTQGRGTPRLPGTRGPGGRIKIPRLPRLPFGGIVRNLAGPFINALLAIWDFSSRKSAGQTDLQAGAGTGGGVLGSIAGTALAFTLFPEPFSSAAGLLTLGILSAIGYSAGGAAADKLTGADKVGYSEGGRITKKTKIKRGIKTKKKPKKLNLRKPTKQDLRPIPPPIKEEESENQQRAWWDFLGWAGTGQRQPLGPGGEMLGEKVTNVGNALGKDDFFGPILKVTSKVILDQEIKNTDYQNVGRGINLLINQGIKTDKVAQGALKYQEGGKVLPVKSAVDAGKWVEDTFRSSIKRNIDKTFMSSKTKYGTTGPMGEGEYDSPTGAFTGEVKGAPLGMNQKQAFATVYELAKKHKAKFPEIVAAQAMHETGYLSESLASVFNSTGRTNAFGQTGDRGYGTITRAGSTTGWTKYPSLDVAVKDNIALWHRVDNHPQNYEAFDTPIEGILAVVGAYSPNKDPANIAKGYTEGSYVYAMQKILKSMGFDPNKSNKEQDLSDSAVLERISPIGDTPGAQPVPQSPGPLGSGAGSEGEEIAGKLGDFMKANRSKIGVTGSIHQWLPRHPPKFTRNYKSYHNENRALDIGGWSPSSPEGGGADEQAPVIAALIEWNKKNKYNPVELIHGSPAYKNYGSYREYPDSHHHHVHVAYAKGGMTLDGPHLAMLGEKGKEIVIDNDSSIAEVTPMLLAINQAKDKQGVLDAIQAYAPYDSRANQTVIIEDEPVQDNDYSQQESSMIPMMMKSHDNSFEFLEYQG